MDYKKKISINGRDVFIIATYKDDETDKEYIIYTDGTKNELEKLKIVFGTYRVENGEYKISKLESKEEEKKILEILRIITKEEK